MEMSCGGLGCAAKWEPDEHGGFDESRPTAPEPTPEAAPRVVEGAWTETVLLDEGGVILAVNEAWRASVDQRSLDLPHYGVGEAYVEMASRFVPDMNRAALEASLAAVRTGAADSVQHTYAIETTRGPRWRQLRITPLRLEEGVRYVVIHEDLTELVRAREALSRTSERLLTAQDDERQRIALELHDSTAQHLAVMGMGLARLRRQAEGTDRDAVLDDMGRALDEAVRETRVISYLLKPNGLVQEGLVTTARRFAKGFGKRTGLEVRFQADCEVELAATVEHAAFRIVQEALANVYRHAQASTAEVALSVTDGVLAVAVADDGRGIPATLGGNPEGLLLGVGIVGMRARVEQLGGRLEITSSAAGTRVLATLPVNGDD
jgi:signal transduction histidine kinase